MELSVAIDLIKEGVENKQRQVWADLGCGSGLFSEALLELLTPPLTIYAIDRDVRAAKNLTAKHVKVIEQDFVTDPKLPEIADGILMANSLHYVRDKSGFLDTIKGSLKNDGRMIVIEYERFTANPWVPYPIDIKSLQELSHQAGFKSCVKLNEYASVFNRGMMMYSAVMKLR